jgi:nitroreductase
VSITTLSRARLNPELFAVIEHRVSRRRFEDRAVEASVLDRVEATCRSASAESGTPRAVLVRRAPQDIFTGLVKSYGRVIGAPSLIAFVGGSDSLVELGYMGQTVILDATLAGLDTCWIAGSFSAVNARDLVDLAPGESVRAVTPLGYATKMKSSAEWLVGAAIKPRSRLALDEIAPGSDSWPSWAREAAAAVRLAPSGSNRQPWRLRFEDGALVLASAPDPYWTAPMDLGVAMLHAELGAQHAGVLGEWVAGTGDDVARFTPQERS